jgi:predicted tellurium resistance membrane protein TerC
MTSEILTSSNLLALATLTLLEIVLGLDNLIFISILVEKIEYSKQALARTIGISLALVTRILLLLSISWIMKLTEPVLNVASFSFSGRDLILLIGGLFLIGKATHEIHEKIEHKEIVSSQRTKKASFFSIVIQIAILDIVFSLDSVITAVGMVDNLAIMITAIVISMIIMLISARTISDFINKHPTFKILALSFLILIGVVLVSESLGQHISKSTIYFSIAFSMFVEFINMKIKEKEVQ